jgi:hypothetical protein
VFCVQGIENSISHRFDACVAQAQRQASSPLPKDEGFAANVFPIAGGFLAITATVVGLVSTYTNVVQKFDKLDSSIMATNKTIEVTNTAIEKNDLAVQKSLAEILQARLELSNISGQIQILKGKRY